MHAERLRTRHFWPRWHSRKGRNDGAGVSPHNVIERGRKGIEQDALIPLPGADATAGCKPSSLRRSALKEWEDEEFPSCTTF